VSESDVGLHKPSNIKMEIIQNEETIDSLVAEFNCSGELVKEHHIKRGKAASRAKSKGKNGFDEFCEKTSIKPQSSTARKYVKIGNEADWLEPIIAHLPTDNWTTIYDVAVLGNAKAEELIGRGILHPQATAKQLREAAMAGEADAVAPDTETEGETNDGTDAETYDVPEPCVFQIDATGLTDKDRLRLYHDLVDAVRWLDLTVTGLPNRLATAAIIDREAA
jgi:hypothetical protein